MLLYDAFETLCHSKNRRETLISILKEYKIPYIVHVTYIDDIEEVANIMLPGIGHQRIMFTAHHDVCDPNIDNANDNTASIINLINLKLKCPEVSIVFTDKEEPPYFGKGARELARMLHIGQLIEMVVNLELTGIGGDNILYDTNSGTESLKLIKTLFHDAEGFSMPFSDSRILNELDIDAVTLMTAEKKGGHADLSIIDNIHTQKDSLDTIDIDAMNYLVNNVLIKIARAR